VGSSPQAVAVADLDGDDDRDIVTANSGSGDVSVLLNTASGLTAESNSPYSVGSGPHGVAVADLDGDTHVDVVTANRGSDDVSVLLNDGSGSLTGESNSPYAVGDGPADVVVIDASRSKDVATANEFDDNVSVLSNDGSAGFGNETPYQVGQKPIALAAGNFDPTAHERLPDNGHGVGKDVAGDLVTANSNDESLTVLVRQ
jgi:hypothetical protein